MARPRTKPGRTKTPRRRGVRPGNSPALVAVHWNFARKAISIRSIHPSGKLGRLLATATEIVLDDAVFTFDRTRWERWRAGNTHARQVGEIRGRLSRQSLGPGTVPVRFDMREDPGFRVLLNGRKRRILSAARVIVEGRAIRAAGVVLAARRRKTAA